jgi:malate dehydrogenase (oxaloacetate-decarboxylating)
LLALGLKYVVICDREGAIYKGRAKLNPVKEEIAEVTNPDKKSGTLEEVMRGADVFIGVSAPNVVTRSMVRSMAKNAIVFACANPTPEIFPADALEAGAAVVASGRSDFANQVNNVLAFPGIFRGALDVRAADINDAMKVAAAYAIAGLIAGDELRADYIIPTPFDPRVKDAVACAVGEAARNSGVARL